LAGDLGIPCPVDETSSSEALESVFAQLLSRLAALRRVILLVDALDHGFLFMLGTETGTRLVLAHKTVRAPVSLPVEVEEVALHDLDPTILKFLRPIVLSVGQRPHLMAACQQFTIECDRSLYEATDPDDVPLDDE
jgi:hypothetical protein